MSQMSQDTLISPFQIKGFRVKNRIGVAPMTRMSSPKDSIPRPDVLEFLVRRVRTKASEIFWASL
jgi:2,4-dienoyl-CoA reductase-like NADH-dependent reductase (Old Yellow Enzyme family)